MKAVVTDKRPCNMGRGDIRRVPQDRSYRGLVGYHVGCPACGFVTAVINGARGLMITEDAEKRVTFSQAATCVRCSAELALSCGELQTRPARSSRGAAI